MSAVRLSDGLLSRESTLLLVGFVAASSGGKNKKSIVSSVSALQPSSLIRIENTLHFLAQIGVLAIDGENVQLSQHLPDDKDERRVSIAYATLDFLLARYPVSKITPGIQFNHKDKSVWIDAFRLPGRSIGLPFFLTEFGVFHREKQSSRHWLIDSAFSSKFLSLVREDNYTHRSTKRITAEQLKAALEEQAAVGAMAENWVVSFERISLAEHPFAAGIRRISDEDVSAGYDILSFSSLSALRHDKFIEVKCCGPDLGFYWTRNEIDCAKELGESYFLYLVERAKMDDSTYIPTIIRGAYSYFFKQDPIGWERACREYAFRLFP